MKTILITGGAGFVGSCLALGLREHYDDARIVALDNLKRRGSELNLARLRQARVDFVHGDIRNPEDLDAAGKVDLILECSAEPSVLSGYGGSPSYVVNTNLSGSINCFEVARRHGAGVIFLSTSRVYPFGAINQLPYMEEATRFSLGKMGRFPIPGLHGGVDTTAGNREASQQRKLRECPQSTVILLTHQRWMRRCAGCAQSLATLFLTPKSH